MLKGENNTILLCSQYSINGRKSSNFFIYLFESDTEKTSNKLKDIYCFRCPCAMKMSPF